MTNTEGDDMGSAWSVSPRKNGCVSIVANGCL